MTDVATKDATLHYIKDYSIPAREDTSSRLHVTLFYPNHHPRQLHNECDVPFLCEGPSSLISPNYSRNTKSQNLCHHWRAFSLPSMKQGEEKEVGSLQSGKPGEEEEMSQGLHLEMIGVRAASGNHPCTSW